MHSYKPHLRDLVLDVRERYERDKRGFTFRLLYALLVVAFCIFLIPSSFTAMRQTLVFDIIRRALISSLVLYFAWISKHRPEMLSARIVMSLVAPTYLLPLILPSSKLSLLFSVAVCWIGAGFAVCLWIFREEHYIPLTTVAVAYAFFIMLSALVDYTYLNSPNGLKFWGISLILAIACGIASAVMLCTGMIALTDDRTGNIVGVVLAVIMGVFFMTMCTANHLNYALDTTPANEQTVIITNKDVYHSSMNTHYELYFWYEGEERIIEVAKDEYNSLVIGDRFDIEICDGAFVEAFIKAKEKSYVSIHLGRIFQ